MTPPRPRQPQPGSPNLKPTVNGWVIAGVVGVVVAIAAIVAVVATSDDQETGAGLEQTRPVTITGTPLPAPTDTGADPAVGATAPTVTGATFDGTPVTIDAGRPTLLVFLAHWCPHCQREVPLLTDWETGGGVPEGVAVIGVATGTTADRPNYPPSEWLEREQFPFPVLVDSVDSDAAEAFGLRSYPYFVALDSNGRVVARASGSVDPTTLTDTLADID